MHPALCLEEILYVVFCHCFSASLGILFDSGYHADDLVALARTCRVFKEPALDVLWAELKDATPLMRCLPEVCTAKSPKFGPLVHMFDSSPQVYMFKRQLKETEREIVKSYTRRVRSLTITRTYSLDLRSLEDLCLPATADPLFPNIRRLNFCIADQTLPLMHHISSPMLEQLELCFIKFPLCETFLRSLGTNFPNMNKIQIFLGPSSSPAFNETMSRNICHWTDLQRVDCSSVSLDFYALSHLSRMPRLTMLAFTLGHESTDQISALSHSLTFSVLRSLQLSVASGTPASNLFLQLRFPAVTSIRTAFRLPPSKEFIRSFLMTLKEACTGQAAIYLSMFHTQAIFSPGFMPQGSELGRSVLTPEDIHHFTALNLNEISIDLDWAVDLKDNDLLAIASVCPQLTSLNINEDSGWRGAGITPNGLARFLQRCQSLQRFGIVIDTRSPPPLQTSSRRSMACIITANVADSPIEANSVPAMAAFFADVFPNLARDTFFFRCWGSHAMRRRENVEIYTKRWQEVCTLAKQKVVERH